MTAFVFHGLPLRSYGAIMADPPWAYTTWAGEETVPHRTQEAPYRTMTANDLSMLPVAMLAKPDCVLFLWTISSHLDQAFPLAEAWGFKYKAKGFEWFKRTIDGKSFRMGMGKWTRQETETCLIFTRGKPGRRSAGVRQAIEAVPRGHSRKPDEIYGLIERLVAGPYVELFAKYRRIGWSGWGDQYPKPAEEQVNRATAAIYRSMGRCEKGHDGVFDKWPYVNRSWPHCDETCIPF